MQERIIQIIHQSIESKMQTGELLAPLISHAGEIIVQALLNEKKILVAGNGSSNALGQLFVANLVNRFEQERPSLPAMCIGADSTTLSAIASDYSYNDIFAKPIRALGQMGDILLVITASGNAGNLVQAIASAHDRGMTVVALTGKDGGDIATLLDMNDIELRAPSAANLHIIEIHLLCLLCINDLIDYQLFGMQE